MWIILLNTHNGCANAIAQNRSKPSIQVGNIFIFLDKCHSFRMMSILTWKNGWPNTFFTNCIHYTYIRTCIHSFNKCHVLSVYTFGFELKTVDDHMQKIYRYDTHCINIGLCAFVSHSIYNNGLKPYYNNDNSLDRRCINHIQMYIIKAQINYNFSYWQNILYKTKFNSK